MAITKAQHPSNQPDNWIPRSTDSSGFSGGHLHLFTSPKDAEDDCEVWNPEEFPPEAGIKSHQTKSRPNASPKILTSNVFSL